MRPTLAYALAGFVATMLAATPIAAAPTIAATPASPKSGEPVKLELRNSDWPLYLPATRYAKNGSTFVIDYEYVGGSYSARADFGQLPISLGELVPGTYSVQARLFDINQPSAPAQIVTSSFTVSPPAEYGLFTVPRQPDSKSHTQVVINSAAYLDPASVRVSQAGSVVRVDFDFDLYTPVTKPAPAGMVPYVIVDLPALTPGSYVIEGWGRPKSGGNSERFFVREVSVSPTVPVMELYAGGLDHYFMTAWADELAALDAASSGWQRTGQKFKAWATMGEAPMHAKPVCRFYAKGPNSHFYTGEASECDWLKGLEADGRAQSAASGQPFLGWAYEGVAFYAIVPVNGQCPAGTTSVYRSYNNRAAQNDSNHRFTSEPVLRAAMSVGWVDEGVVFCSPQ